MSVNLINSNDININQTNDDIELEFSSARQQELLDIKNDIENLQNYTSDISTYSTTEHIVGKWINGKPIYRKIINLGNLSSSAEIISYAHGITNIDTFTKIEGMVNNGQEWFPFNSVFRGATTFDYDLGLLANKVNIVYSTKTNRSAYQGWVLLEYTKTTD